MAEALVKKKSFINKRSLPSFSKHGRKASMKKKSLTPKFSEVTEESFHQWDELKEDMDNDNFIYGLHDEVVEKALEEIREKRSKDEMIQNFVDSFCKAWLKLVKWRWMVRDDKGKDIVRDDDEPSSCPKDPWSSRSYGEPKEVEMKTSLPPPLRCCPHPPLIVAEEQVVEKPITERIVWIQPAKQEVKAKRKVRITSSRTSIPRTKAASEQLSASHVPPIPKTAFPERGEANICMGPQMPDKKRGSKAKMYTSEIDLTQSSNDDHNKGNHECQQYSRLDL